MHRLRIQPISETEYLTGEPLALVRHEFVNGHVYAMAGASKAHNAIALNIAMRVRSHLRGTPCRTYIGDMKVRVAAASAYFYPDVVVSCANVDSVPEAPVDHLLEPKLIVEVLSPSTEATDRREKMRAYGTLQELSEYVLVDSQDQRVEVYRKLTEGGWEQWIWGPGEHVPLESVDLTMTFQEIYEDVGLLPPP